MIISSLLQGIAGAATFVALFALAVKRFEGGGDDVATTDLGLD